MNIIHYINIDMMNIIHYINQTYLFCWPILLECIGYAPWRWFFNPLNAELNPIYHLLALLGAHHIFHVSELSVKGWNVLQLCKVLTKWSFNNMSAVVGVYLMWSKSWRPEPCWASVYCMFNHRTALLYRNGLRVGYYDIVMKCTCPIGVISLRKYVWKLQENILFLYVCSLNL
jgi:hypothetical protein